MPFQTQLVDLLKKDPRFLDDSGELLIAAVEDCAWKLDKDLVRLLLSDENAKAKFFSEIDGYWIFNVNTFLDYISQKDFLDNSYTRFRNKIGLTVGGKFLKERGEVALVWPYKDCVLEGGQTKEEEKRKEIFFNEVLAEDEINRLLDPKVLTNFKRYTVNGEEEVKEFKRDENGVIRENLIIKGNNLIALHSLVTQFRGQVKLIYIDPPFNTGNDSFGYNDNFNHSTWLTFMRNRLMIAKELLMNDGVILVHCDYIEEHYTKVIMDEIFSSEHYVNSISIRDSHPSGLKLSAREKTIIKTKSTILVYKNGPNIKINPLYQPRKAWDTHFNSFIDIELEEKTKIPLSEYILQNKIVNDKDFCLDGNSLQSEGFRRFIFEYRDKIFQSTKEIPKEAREKSLEKRDSVIEYQPGEFAFNGRRLSPLSKSIYNIGYDGYYEEDFAKLLCDFWDDIDFNNSQNEGGVSFPSGKKPELLLARLITMFTVNGDTVLDYHLGSGTTASVAHKMGRQYIGIEQLNYGKNDSHHRLLNVIMGDPSGISRNIGWKGGGDFITFEISKNNEVYFGKIQNAVDSNQVIRLFEEISESSFLKWYLTPDLPDEALKIFRKIGNVESGLEKQKRLLFELIDKNQIYINLSEIDDERFAVSETDNALNRSFYGDAYGA